MTRKLIAIGFASAGTGPGGKERQRKTLKLTHYEKFLELLQVNGGIVNTAQVARMLYGRANPRYSKMVRQASWGLRIKVLRNFKIVIFPIKEDPEVLTSLTVGWYICERLTATDADGWAQWQDYKEQLLAKGAATHAFVSHVEGLLTSSL